MFCWIYHYLLRSLKFIGKHDCKIVIIMKRNMIQHMTKWTKWHVHPAKTWISLGIRQVWSESSLSAWRKLRSLATHWAQARTLIRLGRRPGWSESSLGAQSFCWFCRVAAVFTVHLKKAWVLSYPFSASEDSDQTGQMPRLIWVFTGCTIILLELSRGGSYLVCLDHALLAIEQSTLLCWNSVLFVFVLVSMLCFCF